MSPARAEAEGGSGVPWRTAVPAACTSAGVAAAARRTREPRPSCAVVLGYRCGLNNCRPTTDNSMPMTTTRLVRWMRVSPSTDRRTFRRASALDARVAACREVATEGAPTSVSTMPAGATDAEAVPLDRRMRVVGRTCISTALETMYSWSLSSLSVSTGMNSSDASRRLRLTTHE